MAEDRPGYSFGPGAPPEASRFLRTKSLAPSFRWDDVEPEEHAVAFAVAGVAEMGVLEDVRGVVQRALDEGQTVEQFRAGLKDALEAKGWCGPRTITDPVTGETRTINLSAPRRVRTIYRANLRSARAAGQWERIERTKDALPWLEYRLGPSEVHRPDHAALEGTILPADDAFWSTHFPPNGWGCKCWVRQMSTRQMERRGGPTERPEVMSRTVVNRRTGARREVPIGTDPGWDVNPGMRRLEAAAARQVEAVRALPTRADRRRAVDDVAGSWAVGRRMREARDRPRELGPLPDHDLPVALVPAAVEEFLGTAGDVLVIRNAVLAKTTAKHDLVPGDLADLTRRLEEGEAYYEEGPGYLNVIVDAARRVVVGLAKGAGDEPYVATIMRANPGRIERLRQAMRVW